VSDQTLLLGAVSYGVIIQSERNSDAQRSIKIMVYHNVHNRIAWLYCDCKCRNYRCSTDEIKELAMTDTVAVGSCTKCGFVLSFEQKHVRVECPRCGNRVTVMTVAGNFSTGIVCNADCQFATGHDCDCSCGGENHGRGYIEINSVPMWVRDRDDKRFADKAERKENKARKARQSHDEKINALIDDHPVLAWLSYIAHGDIAEIFNEWNEFLADMNRALFDKGVMSERQISAAENAIDRLFTRYAITQKREADKAALVKSGVQAPEGKVTVTGEIVSIKDQPDNYNYYGGVIWKMVVKTVDGWAVWVTIPSTLIDSVSAYNLSGNWQDRLLHKTVTFTATLTRSDKDPLFAFGKRPTKAQLVSS